MPGIQCVGHLFKIYMTPVYKIPFYLDHNESIGTSGLGKIMHIFAASTEMLLMLHLILQNSPFPCIIAIFLNKILLEIRVFSKFFKIFRYMI